MNLFKTNQNKPERILRLVISLFLIPTPFILGLSTYSMILCLIGAILFFNSVVGTCYTYRLFGIDTFKIDK
mgnify:CR=1 FL=1